MQKTQPLYCWESFFTDPLPSNGRPIVPRVRFRGNMFTESLPSNGSIRHPINPSSNQRLGNRDSSVGRATGYGLDSWGLIAGRTDRLRGPPSFQSNGYRGLFPPGVKRPGCKANHLPPSSVDVKNGGAIPPLPHASSWRGASLIKRRDNFPFFNKYLFPYGTEDSLPCLQEQPNGP
jgi:hypothetical protein